MTKSSRKIHWISSLNESPELINLENSLANFYSNDPNYYSDINFTDNNWKNEPTYLQIIKTAQSSNSICEIGCGSANILKHYPELAAKYTGLDFSTEILEQNAKKYPGAHFITFKKSNIFPVDNEAFDLVFSVFVLEHVTRPAAFLEECKRILKPGGTLIILCPDFLGRGRMSSQRTGFSAGTGKEKFRKGKYLDAFISSFDSKIKLPLVSGVYRLKAKKKPAFLINIYPIVFEDKFTADVDAVYLTYKKEILAFLGESFKEISNDTSIISEEKNKALIFLQMTKL